MPRRSPFNAFTTRPTLAGPADTFVSINNDTVYSLALIDVSGGPVRLDVPDSAGRYYVLQFVDAWTNNFAYVGHRATGTAAGTSCSCRPAGTAPRTPGVTVIRCPTAIAAIVGRWAVDGADDLPAVRALQAGLTLRADGRPATACRRPAADVADDLRVLRAAARVDGRVPARAARPDYQQRFAPLGLLAADSPTRPDPASRTHCGRASPRARTDGARAHARRAARSRTAGILTYHVFDYNLDFFEVGALDDPAWKITDPPARYPTRALPARAGLWGNHGYEAAYAMVCDDGDGGRSTAPRATA